jgi:hypothetical protein
MGFNKRRMEQERAFAKLVGLTAQSTIAVALRKAWKP